MYIWIDLEMSGLDPERERILELACVVTDHYLKPISKSLEIVLFQSDETLDQMDNWNQKTHRESGLIERVRQSKINEFQAEQKLLFFLKETCKLSPNAHPLCGNSIHTDRNFLKRYMPNAHQFFHYRNVDVSSFKIFINNRYPDEPTFQKDNKHTALADVMESIEELRFYQKNFLKSKGL